tara:strand:+ start:84 stop:1367 length:1284 start_codon:yes stop_codon:yes gene_type:complete
MRKGTFMGKAKDPAKIIKKLEEKIEKLEAQIEESPKKGINLNDEENSIQIGSTFELHPSVYGWFSDQKAVKVGERASYITKALNTGLLALWQGRVSHALKQFKDEMQSELELVQMYTDSLQERLEKDNKYKTDQEVTVAVALEAYIQEKKYSDTVEVTGTDADGDGNKTGDVLAVVKDGRKAENLGIEVKFATSYGLGDSNAGSGAGGRKNTKSNFRSVGDTAISQILETRSNRESRLAIFVVDEHLNPLEGPPVRFFPAYSGFIVKVDTLSHDFSALEICYEIARQMTLSTRSLEGMDFDIIEFLLRDLALVLDRQNFLKSAGETILKQIVKSHNDNIKVVKEQVAQFDAELSALRTSIKKTTEVLKEFFKTGELSASEMFSTYVREQEGKEWNSVKSERSSWTRKLAERLTIETEAEDADSEGSD